MKISIITVCFNSERYIEQTIKSVISQTYKNIEYIIVDGMSTDTTPQIIDKYQNHISIYLRGKDKNMYDAINKGMAASTGDYIEILNSDDTFYNEYVIEKMVSYIKMYEKKYEVFYGDDVNFYQSSGLCKSRPKIQTSFKELLCSKQLSFVGHGAVFISRGVYTTIGDYDYSNFSAAADYDYLLRVFKIYKCKHIKTPIQIFRIHESSITSSGKIADEINDVLIRNGYYDVPIFYRLFYKYLGWIRFCTVNTIPMIKYKYQA